MCTTLVGETFMQFTPIYNMNQTRLSYRSQPLASYFTDGLDSGTTRVTNREKTPIATRQCFHSDINHCMTEQGGRVMMENLMEHNHVSSQTGFQSI